MAVRWVDDRSTSVARIESSESVVLSAEIPPVPLQKVKRGCDRRPAEAYGFLSLVELG